VEHCTVCKWWDGCDKRRRGDDHLSLVAGASRLQRRELESREVRTLAALALVPIPLQWKPHRGSRESIERIREQARVQLTGRSLQKPVHELLPFEAGTHACSSLAQGTQLSGLHSSAMPGPVASGCSARAGPA
jgi:predicted RecB family nuclease